MGYVLASASPRRRELMRLIAGTDFRVLPAHLPEPDAAGLSPEEAVRRIAGSKAEEVAALVGPEETVIAADTLVYLDGTPLGKPRDAGDAARMLQALSDRAHEVWSGLAVCRGGRLRTAAVCTRVRFRAVSRQEIDAYVATEEPMDKAGAYGIQGGAAVMIREIHGDYYNVMGLPLCALWELLHEPERALEEENRGEE